MKNFARVLRMSIVLALFAGAPLLGGDDSITRAVNSSPATQPAAANYDPQRLVAWLTNQRDQDPIGFFVMDMDALTRLLDKLNTRDPVQPDQQRLVGRLDKLIEMLEKQTSGSGGGSNPTRPMADSRIAKGPGGSGPMHDPKAGTRTWGQLPPKQREQILQSQNEGFPPGFESILSSYYKRLAQEESAAAGPTTQPQSP